MTFWAHFFRLLPRRPIPALVALYWQLTKRKVRARNRLRVASADLPFAYALWIAINEGKLEGMQDGSAKMERWTSCPLFSIVIHSTAGRSAWQLQQSIASVERQIYPGWSRVECSTEDVGQAVTDAKGGFIILLRAGDTLSKKALFRIAEVLQGTADASILYGDEDRIDQHGHRVDPWFKPRWNEELFFAQDYLSSAVAIETGVAKRAVREGSRDLTSLLLAATDGSKNIIHIPHVLVHLGEKAAPQIHRAEAVARHLKNRGATCVLGAYDTVKVEWPLPDNRPLVSLIIPTKDKLELLQPCVQSLHERTDYGNFEILIIDNGSVEERTAKFFEQVSKQPTVRVLSYARPFNYSAINNFAVGHSKGTYLCLLNNDTEVLEPTWLTELMRYAVRSEIGAAGGKLLYEDGSIQHAGVVVGIGEAAGHAHRFLPAGKAGYFRMPHVPQFVSAVTGACLVVEKEKFLSVGGFDEEKLAVAFNDVDLCLRLQAAGWRNVYVPHAVLLHHESKSRGDDLRPAQFDRYQRELSVLQERWGTKTYADPLHNPNLDRYSETYVFRF